MHVLRKATLPLVLVLLFACGPALADPALWVVKSPTATVYLFGTVHVLPKDAKWHYPALDKALAASSKLYVEETDGSKLVMQMLVLKYGIDTQHPLSAQLDATDRARLDAAAKDVGIKGGGASLNPMRPWLAAVTVTAAPILKAGYDPKSGADKQLEREFKAAGKPIGAFETANQQIKFLADLPAALQLDMLRNALDNYAKGPGQLKQLIAHWQSGDVAAIAVGVNGDMRKRYPKLYQVLLVNRNRDWAKQIEGLLKQRGSVFVAVGAAHLAGPDSVQAQLQQLGTQAQRVH